MTGWALARTAARRALEPRAAVIYAILVLATMPAWFVARSPAEDTIALLLGPRGAHAPAGFAAPVAQLAYGLVPWTPLLPFAIVHRGSRRASVLVVVIAIVALVGAALSGRGPGLLPCCALAASVGSLLADLDRAKAPAALLALGVVVLAGLVAHDLSVAPDRVVDVASLPSGGHAASAARSVRVALWFVAGATAAALLVPSRWLDHRPRWLGRGSIIAAAGLAGGLYLRVHTYPDLIEPISPRRVRVHVEHPPTRDGVEHRDGHDRVALGRRGLR